MSDKWYVETGDIKEIVIAMNSADAFEMGLQKGLDKANYNEVEYSLDALIVASNRGFISDDKSIEDEALFNSTSEVLRAIGQENIAEMLEERY